MKGDINIGGNVYENAKTLLDSISGGMQIYSDMQKLSVTYNIPMDSMLGRYRGLVVANSGKFERNEVTNVDNLADIVSSSYERMKTIIVKEKERQAASKS